MPWILKGVFDRQTVEARRVALPWPDGWRQLLWTMASRPAKATKLQHWALLPAETHDGAVKLDALGIAEVTALVYDLDDCKGMSVEEVVGLLRQAIPAGFAWWTTWNHRVDRARVRVIVPLAKPVSPAHANRLWFRCGESMRRLRLPSPDPHHEASRLYVLPAQGAEWGMVEGSPLMEDKAEVTDRVTITFASGRQVPVHEVTPTVLTQEARPNETKARCQCPYSDSLSLSAFLRFHRGLLYLTCMSAHHGHVPAKTWAYTGVETTNGLVPAPWFEGDGGELWRKRGEDATPLLISHCVPHVVATYEDGETGDEWWKLKWKRSGIEDGTATLRRDEIGCGPKLLERAGRMGLDIHDCNRRELTRFLSDYAAENKANIPRCLVASRCGWFGRGFLWGDQWLSDGDGSEAPRELVMPSGDGRRQLIENLRASGDFHVWCEAVSLWASYPLALAGVWASAASCLLPLVGCQPFALEWASPSGTGKTTCLRAAESVWGVPEGLERSWDGTRISIEPVAAFLSCLPLFLDDTKTVNESKNSLDPSWAVYRVISGEGRARATPGGSARSAQWSLLMFSTGEEAIYGSAESGGDRARLVSLQDPPFRMRTRDKVSEVCGPVAEVVRAHHGWLGPLVVGLAMRMGRDKLRAAWATRRTRWLDRLLGDHSAADRLSNHLALIEVGALLSGEVARQSGCTLDLPIQESLEVIARCLVDVDTAGGAVDPTERAWGDFYGWCVARRSSFCSTENNAQPPGGWLGRWDGGQAWTELYFTVEALRRFLIEQGYGGSARALCRQWLKTGLLRDGVGRATWKVRISGAGKWCFCMPRSSVSDEADGGGAVIQFPVEEL